MLRAILLGAVLVLVPVSVMADGLNTVALYTSSDKIARDRQITGIEPAPAPVGGSGTKLLVLSAYAAIDYAQSCEMFFDRAGYHELNPILGQYPSRRDMAAFGILGISAVYLSQELLPASWAQVVLDSVLASEQHNIEENTRLLQGERRRINAVPIILSFRF